MSEVLAPESRGDAFAIADHLASAHKEGFAWGDMAVLCADWATMDVCASALAQRNLPHRVRKKSGDYQPGANAIQVMTMKVSKGLEFPVVALPGVGHMPAPSEDEKEAARVFYVAATRATQRLLMEWVGMENSGASCDSTGDSCVIARPDPRAECDPRAEWCEKHPAAAF